MIILIEGVKVADVVWCLEVRFDKIQDEVSASIAPEICIEVKSDVMWKFLRPSPLAPLP